MILTGAAITILFIMGFSGLWKHNFLEAILVLILAAGLTFIFFRERLMILAAIACGFFVVNAGFTAVFHPSAVGILLTLASIGGLVFFSYRVGKQHPGLLPDDWQRVFDKK
jgi:hypothetical protein